VCVPRTEPADWEVTKGHGERLKETGGGVETGGMALRPFAKHQKRKADDDTTPSAADEFAQFFSNDPRPDPPMDETSAAPAEPPAPTVTMSEHSAAGWYPDSQDPGLMRYWDGFHLTGQTMRVDPARPAAAESGQAAATVATPEPTVAPSPSVTELLAPDQPKVPLLGSQLLSSAVESAPVQEQASSPDRPEPSDAQLDVPVASREDGGSPVAPVPTAAPVATAAPAAPVTPGSPVAPADSPAAPSIARMTSPAVPSAPEPEPTDSWAERTERAVARAQVAGTPEAWQEAAQAAAVVSEMALTMQVAADVRQSTKQLDKVAEESQRRAEEAEELAAEAQRAVTKTAQAAKEAADAASAAARAATEAKQKAERAAEALPRVAARSEDAARAVAAAKRKVQVLEEIVTKAHQANTSEAWHEAHRSAEQAMEQEQRETLTAGS